MGKIWLGLEPLTPHTSRLGHPMQLLLVAGFRPEVTPLVVVPSANTRGLRITRYGDEEVVYIDGHRSQSSLRGLRVKRILAGRRNRVTRDLERRGYLVCVSHAPVLDTLCRVQDGHYALVEELL